MFNVHLFLRLRTCQAVPARALGNVCPELGPGDSYRFLQKERVAEVRLQSQREAFASCSQGCTRASETH